jgi:hypothetical protein
MDSKSENIDEKIIEKVEIPLELLKNLRNVIEVANERIKWKTTELLPVGLLIQTVDNILKNEDKSNKISL